MADKQIDTKKLTTEQRLELLEEQQAEILKKIDLLFSNAAWDREAEMNRRGRG